MSEAFAETHPSFDTWLADWVSGVSLWSKMFEADPANAREMINPFTREATVVVPNKLRRGA
jgi:hypothetical protein